MEQKISDFQELKAESVLSLYGLQDFVVEMKGIFHRNYSPDLMSKPTDNDRIELSRDSIYHLLPEGLFFGDDELKNNELFKEKKKRRKLFFQPFDTEYFNLSLKLEKELNDIFEKHLFNLKNHIDKDILPEIKEDIICLSDFINRVRGNEMLIIDILKLILNIQKIELVKNNHPDYPEITRKTFIIHILNLSTEEYFQKNHQIEKIFTVFEEYFLPFDVEYDFKIKDRQQKFILYENLILDYNTNL